MRMAITNAKMIIGEEVLTLDSLSVDIDSEGITVHAKTSDIDDDSLPTRLEGSD